MLVNEIKELAAKITGVSAQITELKDSLGAAIKERDELKEKMLDVEKVHAAKVDELTKQLAEAQSKSTELEAKVTETEASVEKRAAAKAAAIVAGQGVPPIENQPAVNPTEAKKDEKLFGLDRVIAAFKRN